MILEIYFLILFNETLIAFYMRLRRNMNISFNDIKKNGQHLYDTKLNKIYVRKITPINENYYNTALKAENT